MQFNKFDIINNQSTNQMTPTDFQKMFNTANWVTAEKTRAGNFLRTNLTANSFKVSVKIYRKNAHRPEKKYIFARIGNNILDQLGWQPKDNILLAYDKDDQRSMMLVKNPKGYSLHKEATHPANPVKIHRVQFPVESWCILDPATFEPPFFVDKENKRILFRLQENHQST